MDSVKRFYDWVRAVAMNPLGWWYFVRNKKKHERTRQWLKIGDGGIPVAEAYRQILAFIRETVNLAPRPYGMGAYGLIVAAIWEGDRSDRLFIEFSYQEREAAYIKVAEYMAAWEPPPEAIMAGVLPYGALVQGVRDVKGL